MALIAIAAPPPWSVLFSRNYEELSLGCILLIFAPCGL